MRKYILILIPFLISSICFIVYASLGTGDNSATTMPQQFYLLVGSMIFFFIGIVSVIAFFLTKVVKKMNEM